MAAVPANIPASTRPLPLLPERLEERLRAEARRLGFSLCGIAPATEADTYAFYQHWLAQGYAGEMQYLHIRAEARRHPRSILQDVRSVVMLAMDYGPRPLRRSVPPSEAGSFPGRVAFYAAAPDYHPFLWQRLNLLADWLRQQVPGCQAVGVCDTAPLLERDFARRAGLGWIGKNTLTLQPDAPFPAHHCGTCTACLQACPTQAFPAPYVLDARRCISYLTIEHRSAIPATLAESIGDWLFGCDICQQVCPWNRKPQTSESPFVHHPEWEWLDPVTILRMDEATFRQRFRSTALWRAKRRGLRRNAVIVLGNCGDTSVLPVLQEVAQDADPVVRDAALWAISRIQQRYNTSTPTSSNNTTH
jgi:epoxyqueuosine reductase